MPRPTYVPLPPPPPSPPQLTVTHSVRVEFTKDHDNYLVKYLATYLPTAGGRRGQKIYQRLVENVRPFVPLALFVRALIVVRSFVRC